MCEQVVCEKVRARVLQSQPSLSPSDDPGSVHFDTLHHVIHHFSFSRVSHYASPSDGTVHHSWPQAQYQVEGNFERLYHLWGSSLTSHNLFSKEFFLPN